MQTQSSLRLLLVEDDARIRVELIDALRAAGYTLEMAETLAKARELVRGHFDLIMLDLGLPDGDGLELIREQRAADNNVPILVLTARDAPEQRVRGLDVGADDYLIKPFHLPELLARIRSVLRRTKSELRSGRLEFEELWLDPTARRAGIRDSALELKPREFDLLAFLMEHRGRAWTRAQLLERVWGSAYAGDERTVDTHMRRLRARIEKDPADPHFIETVWGVGYRMRDVEA